MTTDASFNELTAAEAEQAVGHVGLYSPKMAETLRTASVAKKTYRAALEYLCAAGYKPGKI